MIINKYQHKTTHKDVFLVFGAMGAGKTTVGKYMKENYNRHSKINPYDFIELDDYIRKDSGMSVTEYFKTIGYEKFYEHSVMCVENIIENFHKEKLSCMMRDEKPYSILLIDIGAGSTFDYRAISLVNNYQSIHLSADSDYLYTNRSKCIETYKEFGYYNYFHFNKERDILYNKCDIKIDVAYLTVQQVAENIDWKIKNYLLELNQK